MGPLIFIARTHQIKRKKSQLNMRLMKITSQRQQLAEQISNAQQAKTARSNCRNMWNRMNQNQLQNQMMLNMMNQKNMYSTFGTNVMQELSRRGVDQSGLMNFSNWYNGYSNMQEMLSFQRMQNQLMGSNFANMLSNQIDDQSDQMELEQLNAIDSQLEQEQTGIETQLKLLEAEEQSVQKQMDQEIKNSAPKFGLSG